MKRPTRNPQPATPPRPSASSAVQPGDPITDRKTVTDAVADVMHQRWPSWSIDTLLCHPHAAIAMATDVCKRLQRKPTEAAVAEICRVALSSRKRGDLRRDKV
jgi:hypothetical protein